MSLSYNLINQNLNILLKSDMNCLVILSAAGLGKTSLIISTMKERNYEQGEHYLYYTSYFTPLAFYQTLTETTALKSPKLLVLDDVETILRDKNIINLLKSATWENEKGIRQVNYVSTTTKIKDKTINFDGKIIILINETPDANPLFKAIIDRVLFCEINLTREEILEMMKTQIIPKPYKNLSLPHREKIFQFIKKNTSPDCDLSFRVLIKAFNFYLYAPNSWQTLTLKLIKPNNKQNDKLQSRNLL